ncbi:MAG TPA: ABC transporter permease [Acidobacteriota bacterium]|nr:ABC transporter permease [Acidobacteriota bacterium]
MNKSAPRLHWLLRLGLRSLPRRMERDEIGQTLALREADARREGRSLLVFRLRECADLLRTALHWRLRPRRGRRKPNSPPRRGRPWTGLSNDLRYAWRTLLRRPLWTASAAATLTLGLGATVSIFSAVEAVLLSPLPYPQAERLVHLREVSYDGNTRSVAWLNFQDWKRNAQSFSQMAAYSSWGVNLQTPQGAQRLSTGLVSRDFLDTLGVKPLRGRLPSPLEYQRGAAPVAVISHGLWMRQWGGDNAVLGREIDLADLQNSGAGVEIVGILPPQVAFPSASTELWIPLAQLMPQEDLEDRGSHPGIRVLGRLDEGVSLEAARQELDAIALQLAERYPESNKGTGIFTVPLRDHLVGDAGQTVLILALAAGLVLLIACANVAGLLVARGAARQREFSLRTALGAGRWPLLRLLLTEGFALALLGGAAGLALAWLGIGLIRTQVAPQAGIFGLEDVTLDPGVVLFALAASLVSGLLFSLTPLTFARRASLRSGLETDSRSASGGTLLRRVLVTGEVALSLTLLLGAGWLVVTLQQLLSADPGFQTRNVLTAEVDLSGPQHGFAQEATRQFYEDLTARLEALPQVQEAAAVNPLPLSGYGRQWSLTVPGNSRLETGEKLRTDLFIVQGDYFKALSIPLRSGRLFSGQDDPQSPRVVVIDETLARRVFDGDPLGRLIQFGDNQFRVIGVVGHVKPYGVDALSRPQAYVSAGQRSFPAMRLVVKTTGDPLEMAATVRQAVLQQDKTQLVHRIRSLEDYRQSGASQRKLAAGLLGIFAITALVLAVVGLYGVLSYEVARRRREMGVRLSLGASRSNILGLILKDGLKVTLAGLTLGLAAGLPLSRLLSGLLFNVTPYHPGYIVSTAALLLFTALLACLAPALRATRTDPVRSLRCE